MSRSLIVGVLLFLATPGSAGTICGTVRDAGSGTPIPRAGVFLRETGGIYTGLHAATDSSGNYCIDDIPPGFYDLECRVDDYLIGYVRDVPVDTDLIGVDVDLVVSRLHLAAWPNPASSRVFLEFSTNAPGPVRIEIFDLRGRRVRGWSGGVNRNQGLTWDFRDARGRLVPAGVYFARLSNHRGTRVARILRVP